MDPRATLLNLIEALHDGEIDSALAYAETYSHWVSRGGFECDCRTPLTSDAWITLCQLLAERVCT